MTGTLTPIYVESFLEEWLWFGALHEFERACGVKMNAGMFIQLVRHVPIAFSILSHSYRMYSVRKAAIERLVKEDLPLDLRAGEYVYLLFQPGPQYG